MTETIAEAMRGVLERIAEKEVEELEHLAELLHAAGATEDQIDDGVFEARKLFGEARVRRNVQMLADLQEGPMESFH